MNEIAQKIIDSPITKSYTTAQTYIAWSEAIFGWICVIAIGSIIAFATLCGLTYIFFETLDYISRKLRKYKGR